MLRNPGQMYDFNGRREPYPDIRLIDWAGGNPFHHHQDLNALHEAWQKPDTIIVNEPWWTATAKRADIVFPATTPYEREDIGRTNMDDYLFHMPKLIHEQFRRTERRAVLIRMNPIFDTDHVAARGVSGVGRT
jgi:biotin/methionine sulfoxide reductase